MNTVERKKCFCGTVFEEEEFRKSAEDIETYKEKAVRPSCFGEAIYEAINDATGETNFYCIMHFPDQGKSVEEFYAGLKANFDKQREKGKRYNFRGYWFPEDPAEITGSFFRRALFDKETSFRYAVFNVNVDFNKARFENKVSFWGACFKKEADFSNCEFKSETTFTETTFGGNAVFWRAKFAGETFFYKTDFQLRADFSDAVFSNYVIFRGDPEKYKIPKPWTLYLEDARFEKPEQTIFQSIRLYPSYFISHQIRKFVFVGVDWGIKSGIFDIFRADLARLEKMENPPPNLYRLLNITYYQLAGNAEENSRYQEASNFRLLALESEHRERREKLKNWWNEEFVCSNVWSDAGRKLRTMPGDVTHFFYRWTSYYGENWRWAAFMLFLILAVPAFIYTQSNFLVCHQKLPQPQKTRTETCDERRLGGWEAVKHSLGTATLQKNESRKPTGEVADWVVALEAILAPIQFALLALALRRKFMR